MKHLLPGKNELALFGAMAVVLATVVSLHQLGQRDLWLAGLSCPLFITCAVLGLRRSPQWQEIAVESDELSSDSSIAND